MTISTEDCKQLLVNKFPKTNFKDWKRTKKFKNEQGFWIRDFYNSLIGNISIIEQNNEISILDKNLNDNSKDNIDQSQECNSLIDYYMKIHTRKSEVDDDEFEAFDQDEFDKKLYQLKEFIPKEFYFCLSEDYLDFDTLKIKPNSKVAEQCFYFLHSKYDALNDYFINDIHSPVLKDYGSFIDETNFQFDEELNLTYAEAFKLLQNLGYTFDSTNCNVPDISKKIITYINSEKSTSSKSHKKLSNLVTLKKIIDSDNVDSYLKYINDNQLSLNNPDILYSAFKLNSKNIIQHLFDNKIFLDNENDFLKIKDNNIDYNLVISSLSQHFSSNLDYSFIILKILKNEELFNQFFQLLNNPVNKEIVLQSLNSHSIRFNISDLEHKFEFLEQHLGTTFTSKVFSETTKYIGSTILYHSSYDTNKLNTYLDLFKKSKCRLEDFSIDGLSFQKFIENTISDLSSSLKSLLNKRIVIMIGGKTQIQSIHEEAVRWKNIYHAMIDIDKQKDNNKPKNKL